MWGSFADPPSQTWPLSEHPYLWIPVIGLETPRGQGHWLGAPESPRAGSGWALKRLPEWTPLLTLCPQGLSKAGGRV